MTRAMSFLSYKKSVFSYTKSVLSNKSVLSIFFIFLLTVPAWTRGKAEQPPAAPKIRVGISIPTQETKRWNFDGAYLRTRLREEGYSVDLQFAQNNSRLQSDHIRQMADAGAKYILVTPVEAGAIIGAVDYAASKGVKIIAYDRPITGSANVECLVFFDPYQIGIAQVSILSDFLGLYREPLVVRNIEIVRGPQTSLEAAHINAGAAAALAQFLDSGKAATPSMRHLFPVYKDVGHWRREDAARYMADILASVYPGGKAANGLPLSAVLAATDTIALGVMDALREAGYGAGGLKWPAVVGLGCDLPNVRAIVEGNQAASIFMDPRRLAHIAVSLIDRMVHTGSLPDSSPAVYPNGAKDVPVFPCTTSAVIRSFVRPILVDSGYYTAQEVGL
jgi:putative multiple sugar transport system substrate-binding protein